MGSLLAVQGGSRLTTTTGMDTPITPPWEMMPSWSDKNPPYPPARFMEIAQALQGEKSKESSLPSIISIPPEEVTDPYEVMG